MICSKCTHESYCDMAQFGEHEPPITACYKFKKKQQTNADRIRSMSDEELAMIICCQDHKQGDECFEGKCYDCLLDWLKQEVE